MTLLGLGKLLVYVASEALPQMVSLYTSGFAKAWHAGELPEAETAKRAQLMHAATEDFAQGHIKLLIAILTAVVVYLTKGQMKTLVAELNASKFGPKFAQWIQANEPRLVRHPALQPQKPLGQVVRDGQERSRVAAQSRKSASGTDNATKAALTALEKREPARAFYMKQGYPAKRIDAHLDGIDFSKPVEVIKVPKGTEVFQWQVPGAPQGNYYAMAGVKPQQLGISPIALDRATGRIVDKLAVRYVTNSDVEVLRSTAAAVNDTWSIPGKIIAVEGGRKQMINANPKFFRPHGGD